MATRKQKAPRRRAASSGRLSVKRPVAARRAVLEEAPHVTALHQQIDEAVRQAQGLRDEIVRRIDAQLSVAQAHSRAGRGGRRGAR